MYRIALTFTTVNVASLTAPLASGASVTGEEGGDRGGKISRGDKSEARAGGQRCQALSKGALAFVR